MNLRRKPNTDKLLHKDINLKGIRKFVVNKNNNDTPHMNQDMNQDNLDSERHKNFKMNSNNATLNTKTNVLNS